MRSGRRRRSRATTNSRHQHVLGLTISLLCLGGAILAITIGVLAWTMDRPDRVRVVSHEAVAPGQTPWFDAGSTLFSIPIGTEASSQPAPAAWACTLTTDTVTTELVRRPDRDVVGTRVVEGISLIPVVTIGTTASGVELLCTGEAAQSSAGMWVMPTNPGVPRTPLSLVVGGIALLGVAMAVHPRSRALHPFGR